MAGKFTFTILVCYEENDNSGFINFNQDGEVEEHGFEELSLDGMEKLIQETKRVMALVKKPVVEKKKK
jgi:hypothetical protein